MSYDFDVVVIGGGPGGYVCAIRCAQLGLKVACVDKRETLGGTCLNVGCIPSKILLHSSHLYEQTHQGLDAHGITLQGPINLDINKMQQRKDKIVGELTRGIDYLLRKNKITRLVGIACLQGANTFQVEGKDGVATHTARHIVIATGSEVIPLPGLEVNETDMLSSTGALALPEVPASLAIIGAGYIGLELGSVWSRLGAHVTVIEAGEMILPSMDDEVRVEVKKILEAQGLTFKIQHRVLKSEKQGGQMVLHLAGPDGQETTLVCDKVLVAIGRRAHTAGLGLEAQGIATDDRGYIRVDAGFQTTAPGVYAIGDVVGGLMLAHKAEEEGVALAEMLAGKAGHVDYHTIPGIMYTHPEVASVGKTEQALKSEGRTYTVGRSAFAVNSRAKAMGQTAGFVKMLVDATTDEILGCHIVGADAGNLIQEVVLAMAYQGSAEDIAIVCHGHPGLSEAVKEAALDANKRAIHQ